MENGQFDLNEFDQKIRATLARTDHLNPDVRNKVYNVALSVLERNLAADNSIDEAVKFDQQMQLQELLDKIESDYSKIEAQHFPGTNQNPKPQVSSEQVTRTDTSSDDNQSISSSEMKDKYQDDDDVSGLNTVRTKLASNLQSFFSSIADPSILFPNLTAASILALLNIATALAIASLIFSGPLVPFISMGIGMFLIATVVGGVAVPAASGYKAVLSGPRGGQSPIFAAMAAGIVVAMDGQPVENMAVTVVATILVATVFIGFVMFVMGWAKIGAMARYIPFPVMGGFFAGLGYLLSRGGIIVSVGDFADPSDLTTFLQADALLHLAPALAFAIILLIVEKYIKHWLLMPVFLLISLVLFYGILFVSGGSIETAIAHQWLPEVSSAEGFLPVITIEQIALVDWNAVAAQSGTIAVLALLSVIMLLLDTSGVEIVINRDLDPNHELKAAGLVNFVGGFASAPLAFQASADTTFAFKLGGDRFLMILIYGALVTAAIFVGPKPIGYMPPFILAGFLIYIGFSFLIEFVWSARKKLPLSDMLVVCCILFVVAQYGILEGVGAGIGLATILFVHKYSQLSTIKTIMSGGEHTSNIDRRKEDQAYLDANGNALQILILQGFLFFGSASRVMEQIKLLLDGPERGPLKYLVVDFRRVDAMDTSAVNSFAKLMQICKREDLTLCLTGCAPDVLNKLTDLAVELDFHNNLVRFFGDVDEGCGWVDDQLLLNFAQKNSDHAIEPIELLTGLIGDGDAAKTVSEHFETINVAAGETLFDQGDPGDALYLILSGSISIVINLPGGVKLTVRTMRAGAILGEMAVYTGATRSAAAVAKQDCVLHKLTVEQYENLATNHPIGAAAFHTYVVRLMSERLGRANREILALSR